MKGDNINRDIQLGVDAISQTVEEIKEALMKNPHSALTADLLNKIQKTIDQAKEGITGKELEKFGEELMNSIKKLQQEANKSFVDFLKEKVADMDKLAKQPSVIINKYSIDFKSSKTFITIIILFLGIGTSLYFNYNQFQENKRLEHTDIKYRYVQMKGKTSYDDIIYLNKSYAERPQYRDSIKRNVLEFESLISQKVYNQSVNKQNEEVNKQIDKKLEKLTK